MSQGRLCLSTLLATAHASRCVFLHGIGQKTTSPVTDTDTTGYWGGTGLNEFLGPDCTETFFIHEQTVWRGWDNAEVQQAYCDLATGTSQQKGAVTQDTIVITHSLGNLIFAGALHNGLCSLGEDSRWLSLSAPWFGSAAAPWLLNLCTDPSVFADPIQWLAAQLNFCNSSTHKPQQAYYSLFPEDPMLKDGTLAKIAAEHADGALCGNSPAGIASTYSVSLGALAALVPYGEDNDGMVPVSSCMLTSRVYATNDPTSAFYVGRLNHADGTMRDGDTTNLDQEPGRWLKTMTGGGGCIPDGACTDKAQVKSCCSGRQHATASCSQGRCGCVPDNVCALYRDDCCSGTSHRTAACGTFRCGASSPSDVSNESVVVA